MANYISFKPNDFFKAKMYTGTGATGNAVTGVGFQPDMVWTKNRETTDSTTLFDAARGATKYIYPDTNATEGTDANSLASFNADGFTVGSWGVPNTSADNYISYNWKAPSTSTPSGGSIAPSAVRFSAAQGIGIYKYTGTGSNASIAHGLSTPPVFYFVKRLDSSGDWNTGGWLLSNGTYYMNLNTTASQNSNSAVWNSTLAGSHTVDLGTYAATNASGSNYVLYAFSAVNGFSSFGNYKGTGNANGTFVHCGFKPAFVLIKILTDTKNWCLYDNRRWYGNTNTTNFQNTCFCLPLNTGGAGFASASDIDLNSQGFKIRTSGGLVNESGTNYIYMAFADQPTAFNNGDAATAR